MAGGRTPPSELAAARFSITIDGVEIAVFSELVELTSGTDPSAPPAGRADRGKAGTKKKLPGKRTPPTVTLKRGMNKDLTVFAWHRDALARAAARKDATLVMYDTRGDPVARYTLKRAWPAKVVVSGLKAGASEVMYESVTFASEDLERVAS